LDQVTKVFENPNWREVAPLTPAASIVTPLNCAAETDRMYTSCSFHSDAPAAICITNDERSKNRHDLSSPNCCQSLYANIGPECMRAHTHTYRSTRTNIKHPKESHTNKLTNMHTKMHTQKTHKYTRARTPRHTRIQTHTHTHTHTHSGAHILTITHTKTPRNIAHNNTYTNMHTNIEHR